MRELAKSWVFNMMTDFPSCDVCVSKVDLVYAGQMNYDKLSDKI